MLSDQLTVEACVTTLAEALAAARNGADQIELCTAIHLDGLTPSKELITACRDEVDLPIKVLIRPREGNFVYTSIELSLIKSHIERTLQAGANDVVVGMLTDTGTFAISELENLAIEFPNVNFHIHKAIDYSVDPLDTLQELERLEFVQDILTSGGLGTAMEGRQTLRRMIQMSSHTRIVAAGKITASNLAEVHQVIGARAYHGKRIVSLT
ncbi:MAG: copper homeostasis protein CutC [Bacteroidota bacterium]